MAKAVAWYNANDHSVELRNLENGQTGAEITAGTATADIYDVDAAGVLAGSAISLTYTGANGLWRGTMPNTVAVLATGTYKLRATIVSSGLQGYWEPDLKLVTRT